MSADRSVYHLVFNTNETLTTNRIRLYVDGAEQQLAHQDAPVHGSLFGLPPGSGLAVGNYLDGWESIGGRIFYFAIYSEAFTPGEVSDNAQQLEVGDDGP